MKEKGHAKEESGGGGYVHDTRGGGEGGSDELFTGE